MTVVLGNPGSGAGQTTLQGAYDNSAGASPQILLDAVPNPFNIQASVAGAVFDVEDVAGNIIFEVDADPDLIVARTGVTIEDSFTNGGAAVGLTFSDTFTTGGGYLGGGILSNGTVTYDNSFFIWALLQESKTYVANAGPGFAAFTLFNALAVIQNGGNFDLVQALILNNGLVHARTTAGTSNVTQTVGLSNSPQTRATVAGAIMTKTTGDTAVRHSPTFSTVAGSTVNIGTQRGLWCVNPAGALFQPVAGVENMTAYYPVDIEDITFGGAGRLVSGIRSALTLAANVRFLDHTGNANSRLRGHLLFDVDNIAVFFGAAADAAFYWTGAAIATQFTAGLDILLQSNPSADRYLWDTNGGNGVSEFNFNCAGFSLGAQAGANGNQVGNFVAGTRTVSVGGEWSDFLLTQAGNITVDAAMGLVAAWTVNAPSITLGTGTVTAAGVLNVGGNVNQGSVDRFGIRVLSNPSGGSGVNAALWITAGLSRFDGRVDINNGIALGGGAVATLGTIGGSGPTAAAQAQWVEIDIGGVAHWIPAWT